MHGRIVDFMTRARAKVTTQLSFAAHDAGHWWMRRVSGVDAPDEARDAAEHLRSRGYLSLPADANVRSFVAAQYPEMADAWQSRTRTWRDPPTGSTYKLFLNDICERWPAVLGLLDGRWSDVLRAYYGSHFQFHYVEPYRTFPTEGELAKSWLWHRDGVPNGVLKLMVYLNGAHADTGALRVVDRASSRSIDQLGFTSRDDSDRFAAEFENRQLVLAGEPGTAVVIDNTVLHKATAPQHGHRDVVCFQILPSRVPERVARTRKAASRSYTPTTPQYPLLPRVY